MNKGTGWAGMVVCMLLLPAGEAQTVYKSVAADGSITYSSTPPADGQVVDSVELPAATTGGDQSVDSVEASRAAARELETARIEREQRRALEQQNNAGSGTGDEPQLSAQDLQTRCEQARETRIAPLRQAEIDRCKSEGRKDPERCESYWRDYGDAYRNHYGRMTPRMFNDLPECVAAEQARRDPSQ